jgi:hypothetical protein
MADRLPDDFFDDVEKVNGVPEILAPYGFKKVVVDGKKYLAPMTVEEAAELYAGRTRMPKDEALNRLRESYCNGGAFSGRCYPMGACHTCEMFSTSAGWVCVCTSD